MKKYIIISLCIFLTACSSKPLSPSSEAIDISIVPTPTPNTQAPLPQATQTQPPSQTPAPPPTPVPTDIPWGFDEQSYAIYKSGVLDQFIPLDSTVDQCVIADIDMDGIDDVILSVSIPETINPDDIHNYGLNTLLLKRTGTDQYIKASENQNINYFSSYDTTSKITAGKGWFKFTRARGTAGGYECDYLFKYDTNKEDWFYAEYYYNNYGYIDPGISKILAPDNFGIISFKDYGSDTSNNISGEPIQHTDLSVDEDRFKVSVTPCYITLQNKEKESSVNNMINEDIKYIIENLRLLNIDVDISLYGRATFETQHIISIEYQFFGSIDSDQINYSGINRKYITTMIDINRERRIRLSDIIDADVLIQIIQREGFSTESDWDATTAASQYFNTPEDALIKLLETADTLEAIFSTQNTGIFSAIHEKSICLYFQPEFFGLGPDCEEPKLYIPIKPLLPYTRLDFWAQPSEAATHIVWKG